MNDLSQYNLEVELAVVDQRDDGIAHASQLFLGEGANEVEVQLQGVSSRARADDVSGASEGHDVEEEEGQRLAPSALSNFVAASSSSTPTPSPSQPAGDAPSPCTSLHAIPDTLHFTQYASLSSEVAHGVPAPHLEQQPPVHHSTTCHCRTIGHTL